MPLRALKWLDSRYVAVYIPAYTRYNNISNANVMATTMPKNFLLSRLSTDWMRCFFFDCVDITFVFIESKFNAVQLKCKHPSAELKNFWAFSG